MIDLDAAIRAKLAADDARVSDEIYWDAYRDAVLAVLDLHQPPDVLLEPLFKRYCATCGAYYEYPTLYPCPTVRALAEKLGVEVERG